MNTVVRSSCRSACRFAYPVSSFRPRCAGLPGSGSASAERVVVTPLPDGAPSYQRLIDGDAAVVCC